MSEKRYNFDEFKEIIKTLLGDKGCPWDKKQTHKTLKKYLIEECYEVIDAIDKENNDNLCEELGDLLLQIMMHSQIEQNKNIFNIDDVIDGISKKMINRHPHVFGNITANDSTTVEKNWEKIKKKEKNYKTKLDNLKSVPKVLPALMRAEKIIKKSQDFGVGIQNINQAIDELIEKAEKFKYDINKDNLLLMEEYGNILLLMVNISCFFKLNPEFALTNSLEKFINRFEYIENTLISKSKSIDEATIEELNVLWCESKRE